MKHQYPNVTCREDFTPEEINGVSEKITEWVTKGYIIVLTTARKESMRRVTEKQLSSIGVIYDYLIMGLGSGTRYLINDNKLDGEKTAFAITLDRDKGIKDVNI
jgi:hypothetical protein